MKRYLSMMLITLAVCAGFAHALPPISARGMHGEVLTENQRKGIGLSTTPPYYPIEARQARITGSGIYEMRIDPKTGKVKGVLVVQSTGSQILDLSVIRAFSHWRFKSGVVTAVRVPVDFTSRP